LNSRGKHASISHRNNDFQDGKLSIGGLPFRKGDEVEVIVLIQERAKTARERYPLRGTPISYHQPFDGVAEDEWDTLK
jgi:hypothetical protein